MNETDDIKERIDIVDFISRYVPLKRTGRTYKACCPFHQEKTPSFVVFPHTGTWHCFGACSTGGDIFSFLMKQENLDFQEALRVLAQEAGVELEHTAADDGARDREHLYEINAQAAQYFRNLLHRHSDAQAARSYLQNRGIDQEVAETFQLGFALDSWDALRDHLDELGYSLEQQQKAGLLKYNEEHNSYYDAFRNRLTIPIRDRQGRITGFGGRVLDDSVPKYLNTAETPIFHKSHVIYGLDLAYQAIRAAGAVVIVEGYMDVIAAHQFGFENVVACLGTALTEDQLRQLQRYTNNFVLALDADTAGQQATIRGLNQARRALSQTKPVPNWTGKVPLVGQLSVNLSVTTLPPGRDPDEIVRQDPNLWREIVNRAQPLVDYYINVVASQSDLESAQGKGEAVAELVPLIAELGNDIERNHYVERLSELIQVSTETIRDRVQAFRAVDRRRKSGRNKEPRRHERSGRDRGRVASVSSEGAVTEQEYPAQEDLLQLEISDPDKKLEEFLLANLLDNPNLLVWLASMADKLEIRPLNADDLQKAEHKEIFSALQRYITSDEAWDLEAFQDMLKPDLHSSLAALMVHAAQLPQRQSEELREAVIKVVIRMRRERLKESLSAMQFLLQDAQQENDREAIINYSTAINYNRRERHHLERVLAGINHVPFGSETVDRGVRIA